MDDQYEFTYVDPNALLNTVTSYYEDSFGEQLDDLQSMFPTADASLPADADFSADAYAAFPSGSDLPAETGLPAPVDEEDDSTDESAITTCDSAVDLSNNWVDSKDEGLATSLFNFNQLHTPTDTNSPSPPIFSAEQSPGNFIPELTQASSPATSHEVVPKQEEESSEFDFPSSAAIMIPQSNKPTIAVYLDADKFKTRAETQIKIDLTLDPLDCDYLRFPPQCLAKPKQHANEAERMELEGKNILEMQVKLVIATAVEKPEDEQRALRRAAGIEPMPKREPGTQLAELDKDDERHPQNGAEVVICDGCKERERKRYDRKKKKSVDDEQFSKYENDRVIMINEKEYKKFRDPETTGSKRKLSSAAKTIDFAMRIACYCRHQEEKAPQGYRVIFTFTNPSTNKMVAQHISKVFHITDDHKNRDTVYYDSRVPPPPLTIPATQQYSVYPHSTTMTNMVVPLPNNYPPQYHQEYHQENHFHGTVNFPQPATLSQPATPAMLNFQNALSPPIEANFQQQLAAMMPIGTQQTYHIQQLSPTTITPVSFHSRHTRYPSNYDTPLVSPSVHGNIESQIPRPQSMDNFLFNFQPEGARSYPNPRNFASAPGSGITTPSNVSRPASPTWEQGPSNKRNRPVVAPTAGRRPNFYIGGDEELDAGQSYPGM